MVIKSKIEAAAVKQTRIIEDSASQQSGIKESASAKPTKNLDEAASNGGFEKVNVGSNNKGSAESKAEEPSQRTTEKTRTKLVLGGVEQKADSAPQNEKSNSDEHESSLRVVGWLVIVEGQGVGRSIEVFNYTQSKIGRSSDNQIQIDFGDDTISNDKHAMLGFDGEDPEDVQFYIVNGDSANGVKLNKKLMLKQELLTAGDVIRLGKTHVMFVPFAGTHHAWQSQG